MINLAENLKQTNADNDVDLSIYKKILVFTSGGKDSLASTLYLLEQGVNPDSIELHHHLVDGGDGELLMDWPVTEAYLEKFADAFGLRLF